MYARSMAGHEDWTRIENTIPFVRQGMHPVVTAVDGNVGLCLLLDQRGRRYVVISGWESQEAMHASDPAIAPLRAEAAEMLGGTPDVQEWEVAALRLSGDLQPGYWVSVGCGTTESTGVDQVVDAYRAGVLPATAGLDGCRGAMLLVDRSEGRVVTAVVFDGYSALHAARGHGTAIHDLSGVVTGPEDVTDYEIDLADVRLPEAL